MPAVPAQTRFYRVEGALSRQQGATAAADDVVTLLNDFFAANPSIVLLDALGYARGDEENSYRAVVTLVYQSPGSGEGLIPAPSRFGLPYRASYVYGDETMSATNKANAYLLNQPLQAYAKFLSLNLLRNTRAQPTDWIAIMGQTSAPNNQGVTGAPFQGAIAQPTADILAGETGPTALLDARGVLLPGTFTVRNLSPVTWLTGDRNYAVWDWATGMLVGIPSCSASRASLTTTTVP